MVLMQTKTYCGKINGKFRNGKEEMSIQKITIPEDIPLTLERVAYEIIEQYETKLKEIKTKLKTKNLITFGDPYNLERELIGVAGWEYLDLNEGIKIETRVTIPEFFFSLRGIKEKGDYEIKDLMLVNSSTTYGNNGNVAGFFLNHESYDIKKQIPEILRGHFHPPIPRPKHLFHVIAESDLANCPIGGIETLFSMEVGDTDSKLSFFKRVSNRTIVEIPYILTPSSPIAEYIPKVKIEEKQKDKLIWYESVVEFAKK